MSGKLTYIDQTGAANMVDVGSKDETERQAVAEGAVRMKPETLASFSKAMRPRAMSSARRGLRASWQPRGLPI
ncbi:molybdenum cofactor biosynthesis protein C [Brucella ceti TE28753-12]|nr:molybdenum cofactor biosynthesis protein C [Brucella ceti TE28753-12]